MQQIQIRNGDNINFSNNCILSKNTSWSRRKNKNVCTIHNKSKMDFYYKILQVKPKDIKYKIIKPTNIGKIKVGEEDILKFYC